MAANATEKKEVKVVENDVNKTIDGLLQNAKQALKEFMSFDQATIDNIVHEMALAGLDNHMKLAKMAVEETGRGIYEDKIIKNLFATEYIWHNIKNEKTVGIIKDDEAEGIIEIAEPVGVIAGVTPVTNPTSTTMFKSLIALKARNPIVFGFHPSAQKCSVESARILRDAAIKAGAPEHCIQWIEVPSIDATNALMNHPDVALVLATGGSGMVKAAYSTGKPALGVGPGNVPCYIEKSADLERACTDLMLSKTFDNGMICASEQAVIVDEELSARFEKYMKDNSCHFLNAEETEKVTNYVINREKGGVNAAVVGKPAAWIAKNAGVNVPDNTKILIARLPDVGAEYPLSREKLSPVLAYFVVKNTEEGIEKACKMLELGGLGHSAVIHSTNDEVIKAYASAVKVGRVIINSPSSQGGIGDIYNENTPSLTLGCGSFGRNSTTQNVSTQNLLNIKRVAKRRKNMQWFKIPPKIYFENNAVQYLEKMPNISRAFIVCDPMMEKLGYLEKVLYYLRKREVYCHSEIFAEVEPDPSVDTIMRGVQAMRNFKPDVIIALGGGSSMDAAKGMWLFYEHPDTSFAGMKQKFLDIRKRTFHFPELGNKAQLVCIPTTSGTGSEVTSFSVITDDGNNMKYPLADYELTPDVAIIDPQFVATMPKSITADTGMDVLTHAIEAYVATMASDYTDGLCLHAIKIVFDYLVKSYNGDLAAREKMHNASCIAGMAFTNSFLGLNHSMAHKLGAEYHIPHGRANTILLPYVIEYNAQKPTKFASFPKYEKFIADQRYAEIARHLGLPASTTEEGVKSLINAIKDLNKAINEPQCIKDCGVDEKTFMDGLMELSDNAFNDQCTTATPRYPLVSEIAELYKKAYYGK
ncbi:MAG: bifunctional acetaldehyde-CoA/alcohol dehydrogenase [Oscillospiraceae bacterium]|jgi:acetaldehyde dehydrogenase/alcohol dehydrogenase|nr:bifunctional acetaldehyde-CoA/alcohol dehydrogenase [Oscillospiraceae bacterium]